MPRSAFLLLFALSATGCGHLLHRSETYVGPGVTLNGATLSAAFDPQRPDNAFSFTAMVYFAADATTRGPWLLRVQAEAPSPGGALTVHGFRLRDAQGAILAASPPTWFGRVAIETPRGGGNARAVVYVPQPLGFEFKQHPQLTLELDATVARAGTKARRWLRLPLKAEMQQRTEFVSVAGELAKEFSRINKPPPEGEVTVGR